MEKDGTDQFGYDKGYYVGKYVIQNFLPIVGKLWKSSSTHTSVLQNIHQSLYNILAGGWELSDITDYGVDPDGYFFVELDNDHIETF